MRKQTARLLICMAVLPITLLLIHTFPTGPATTRGSAGGPGAPGSPQRYPMVYAASRHPATVLPVDGTRASDETATTAVAGVASTIANASNQVMAQERQMRRNAPATTSAPAGTARTTSTTQTPVPTPETTPPAPASPPVTYSSPPASEAAILACIRQLESGDDYADTSNPYYRGAYQFSYATWAAVGGTGDPAAASPAEQDMRAGMLAAQSGWGQWSTAGECGA